MASSKTVFRPRWVSAEHSKYFTESEEGQQESISLSHGEAPSSLVGVSPTGEACVSVLHLPPVGNRGRWRPPDTRPLVYRGEVG